MKVVIVTAQAQPTGPRPSPGRPFLYKLALGGAFAAVVVVLLLALAGTFHRKVDTTRTSPATAASRPAEGVVSVPVRLVKLPHVETAVGTIRAVHETAVASKLLARIVEVKATAGQRVAEGEVLVRLEDADLVARLAQARAMVTSAEAAFQQAQVEFGRIERLRQQEQAAQLEYDRAATARSAAEAELQRARQAEREGETVLSYATIRAPLAGVIIDKRVESGDTASPGQVLLTIYDPDRMQLVARVRESLALRLRVGQIINVGIDAVQKICAGQVAEIVPEAEAASRTFSVKVTGPCPEGIYSGMFGRLYIPLDDREVLVVPQGAIRRVGQLDLVDVVESTGSGEVLRRRLVQLGPIVGDEVQVLSGLRADERVALPPAASTPRTD